jgi:hypothetical protein
MANSTHGELFDGFTGGRTPPLSYDTRRELELGCESLAGSPSFGIDRPPHGATGSDESNQSRSAKYGKGE